MQRVVERTHVRIHFFLQRAGKKSEPLAGLDGRPRQDDAVHLFRKQRGNGHGDGEIRLARAARADGENHVVGFEGFDVAILVRALRSDALLAERARVRRRKCAANGRSGFLVPWRCAAGISLPGCRECARRGCAGCIRPGFARRAPLAAAIAFDFQVVVAQMRGDVQGGFEEFQVFVESAEEFVDATCESDGLFHSDSRERSLLDTTPIAGISVARDGGRVKAGPQDSSQSNMRRNLSQRRRDGSRSWKVSLLGTACLNMPDCGPCIPQNCIGWLIPGRIG